MNNYYGNKMDNLEEMDKVLEKFSLPRLKQEAIEIMNNLITNTEIEAVIKNSQKTKPQDHTLQQQFFFFNTPKTIKNGHIRESK